VADELNLGDFVCFAIYSANHALNRVYKALLDPLGLTYSQYLVMVVLWQRDGQTVGQIGEKLFLESNTLTPLLKRLEAAGYVSRVRDNADERQVRVMLTPAGEDLREKARSVPACILAASGQTSDQLGRLTAELAALRDVLEHKAA
jgi:DNA-binding MarR family transcriptional regulator